MNRLTILMPTYNSEETIVDTLNSLKLQTDKNFTILVVDAYSHDKTIELIENALPKATILKRPAQGIWDAINYGIQNVTTSHVLILNSDDIISSNVVKFFNLLPQDRLNYPHWLPTYSSAGYLHSINEEKCHLGMHKLSPGHSASFICPMEIHHKLGVYDVSVKCCADHHFFYRLIQNKVKLFTLTGCNCYGVFTTGGFSFTNSYREKVIEEIRFRDNYTLSDCVFKFIISPLKLVWSAFK